MDSENRKRAYIAMSTGLKMYVTKNRTHTEDLTPRGKEDEERAGRWSGEASAVAFVVES
jgi:hypothetical protein